MFLQMALLAPGMSTDNASANAGSDNVSFGGVSEQFKSLFLEGVDVNDEVTGGGTSLSNASRLVFPQESVREFQVLSNQYSVEFGRSATGVINVLTKSGTNQLLGRGYYFLRDKAFDKPNAFASGKTPFRQQQYGATLGGPIREDRVHFFGTYERQVFDDVVTVRMPAFVLPIITDPRTEIPRPLRQHNAFGKVTASLSPAHYLTLMGLFAKTRKDNQDLGGTLAGDAGDNERAHNFFFVGALTSVLTNNFTNELRIAAGQAKLERVPSGALGPSIVFPSITFGQANNHPQGRDQRNYIAMNTVNWHHEGALGTHDIKAGLEANIVKGTNHVNTTLNGNYLFLEDRLPMAGDPTTYPVRYQVRTGDINLTQPLNMYAAFIEDRWRPWSPLTLSIGLRYDRQFWRGSLDGADVPTDIPSGEFWTRFVAGDLQGINYKFMPNDPTNLAPRVGFAWDPGTDGRMVIRGGFGMFFQHIPMATGQGIVRQYPNVFLQSYENDVRVTRVPNLAFPATPAVSELPALATGTVGVPNPVGRFPHTEQFSIGAQRQVASNMAISADFVHTLGLHFPRSYNVNARQSDGSYPLVANGRIMNVNDYGNRIHGNQLQVRLDRRLANNLSFQSSYTYLRLFQFQNVPVDKPESKRGLRPGHQRCPSSAGAERRLQIAVRCSARRRHDGLVGRALHHHHRLRCERRSRRERTADRGRHDVPPNSARGDSYFDTDLRISKRFKLGTRQLEILWEMFNLFNTKNFGGYQGNQRSVLFGQPSFALAPFQGQLGIRFDF